MLYYLIEEAYRAYPWCRNSLKSLLEEIRKRRMSVEEIFSCEEIPSEDVSPVVFILGATQEWTENAIHSACLKRAYPISMSNRGMTATGYTYSAVSIDMSKAVMLSLRYFRSLGRSRTALYGVNPSSTADPFIEHIFCRIVGTDRDVFHIQSDFASMANQFLSSAKDYDSVICCNDYAAVSLVYHLKHAGIDPTKDIYVVAIGDTDISKLCRPSITTVSDNYEHFGTAAMNIYSIMRREDFISSMDILLDAVLHIRETTGNRPYYPGKMEFIPLKSNKNLFFQDQTVGNLLKLETLFNQCDETDFQIIDFIIQNNTYSYIAEQCFISETTAKYRISKMKEICGVSSRAELVFFLKNFIG